MGYDGFYPRVSDEQTHLYLWWWTTLVTWVVIVQVLCPVRSLNNAFIMLRGPG